MTLVKWYHNPLFDWINEAGGEQYNECFRPSTNVMEEEDMFKVQMAVPGFSKKDFKIELEKNVLKVYSEKEFDNEGEYTRREFGGRNFCRSFSVPETVDVENIKAEYKNGILSINLPKKEEVNLKKEIQIA